MYICIYTHIFGIYIYIYMYVCKPFFSLCFWQAAVSKDQQMAAVQNARLEAKENGGRGKGKGKNGRGRGGKGGSKPLKRPAAAKPKAEADAGDAADPARLDAELGALPKPKSKAQAKRRPKAKAKSQAKPMEQEEPEKEGAYAGCYLSREEMESLRVKLFESPRAKTTRPCFNTPARKADGKKERAQQEKPARKPRGSSASKTGEPKSKRAKTQPEEKQAKTPFLLAREDKLPASFARRPIPSAIRPLEKYCRIVDAFDMMVSEQVPAGTRSKTEDCCLRALWRVFSVECPMGRYVYMCIYIYTYIYICACLPMPNVCREVGMQVGRYVGM